MAKNSESRSFSGRLFRILLAITSVLLLLHLLLQYVNLMVFDEKQGIAFELSNRFDMDDEASVPTWFSQFLLILLAAGAGLAAWLDRAKPARRFWLLLAVIGLAFSLDEVAGIHEFSLQTVHNYGYGDNSSTLLANAWLLVLPVLLLGGAFLAGWAWRLMPRRTFWLMAAGGAMFMVGSIAVDWLIGGIDDGTYLSQGILVAIEETLETVGAAVVVYGVADYLETRHTAKIKKAGSSLY